MNVGITTRILVAEGYSELRDGIAQDWTKLFISLGITPIYIPNTLDEVSTFVKKN